MALIMPRIAYQGLLALVCLNSLTLGQQAYPNPFAKPSPAAAQPVAQQQNPGAQGGSGQAGAYPNPFGGSGGGQQQAGSGQAGSGQAGSGQGGAYPNPFGSGGTGGQAGTGGGAAGSGGGSTTSCSASPASIDPNNVAGTCCCDPRKTFVTAAATQPQGGCCAPGHKWAASCQDGGSFKNNPISCPALHRNTRVTPSGPEFELFCNVQTHRKDLKIDTQDTFIDCVDACGATSGCVGVDFDKTTNKCYYKSEYMDVNTLGVVNNDIDSASMQPPPPPPLIECPQARGQILNIGGIDYEIFCDSYLTGTRIIKSFNNAQECAEECSKMGSQCNAFDFQNSSKNCWIQPEYEKPPKGKGGDWITFIPTQKK